MTFEQKQMTWFQIRMYKPQRPQAEQYFSLAFQSYFIGIKEEFNKYLHKNTTKCRFLACSYQLTIDQKCLLYRKLVFVV